MRKGEIKGRTKQEGGDTSLYPKGGAEILPGLWLWALNGLPAYFKPSVSARKGGDPSLYPKGGAGILPGLWLWP